METEPEFNSDEVAMKLCRELKENWNSPTRKNFAELIEIHPQVLQSVMATVDVAVTEFELLKEESSLNPDLGFDLQSWQEEAAKSIHLEQRAEFCQELSKRIELIEYTESLEENYSLSTTDTEFGSSESYSEFPDIERYAIRSVLGEGGMGVVYRADQTSPVKREVAIKVIKPRISNQEILKRFEIERQALAIMNHGNIAKILDAGLTRDQRPYFVMEFVAGVPMVEYCNKKNLSLEARIRLMSDVCRAVQHAHQKGVVHRDLKPSNILVVESEDANRPQVKIIDFGLAKAVGNNIGQESLKTQVGQIVGTLEYMSPEQAGATDTDVDTRSDVYSLGVILYELLTGTTLLKLNEKKIADLFSLKQLFESIDGKRPSSEFSIAGQVSSDRVCPEFRDSAVRTIQKKIKGELDWIVAKAINVDRRQRYETVNAFAEDLDRHLNFEPVQARPPSFSYQLSKLFYRNRFAISLVAIGLAGLLVAFIATLIAYNRINSINTDLVAQTEKASKAALEAKQQAEIANLNADQAEANLSLAEKTIKEIGEVRDDPRLSGQLEDIRKKLTNLEVNYYKNSIDTVGDSPRARRALTRKLFELANFEIGIGKAEAANARMTRAISLLEGLIDEQLEELNLAISDRKRLEHEQLRKDTEWHGDMLYRRGLIRRDLGQYADAKTDFQRIIKISDQLIEFGGEKNQYVELYANGASGLGDVEHNRGNVDEALNYFLEATDAFRVLLSDDSHEIRDITSYGFLLCNVGLVRLTKMKGQEEQARACFEEAISWQQKAKKINSNWELTYVVLGRAERGMALVEERKGNRKGAMKHLEEAMQATAQLSRIKPLSISFRVELGLALEHLASRYLEIDDLERASLRVNNAIEHLEYAFGQDKTRVAIRRALLTTYSKKLAILKARGETDQIAAVENKIAELNRE